MDSNFLSDEEVKKIGLKKVGENVLIHPLVNFVGPERISLGSNVRIDPFVSITVGSSGYVTMGDHIHIGSFVNLAGGCGILLEDFVGLSQGVKIYSSSDDFSGDYLTGPTVPESTRRISSSPIRIGKHVVVGSGSVVLPGVEIGCGSCVGSLSLVKHDLDEWGMYVGVPVKCIRPRSKKLLELEQSLLAEEILTEYSIVEKI